jgi:hypothetical protein
MSQTLALAAASASGSGSHGVLKNLNLNLPVNPPSDSELEARVWLRDSRRLSWRAVMMSRSRGLLPCTFLTSSLPRRGHHLRILKKTCPSPKKPHGVRRPRVTLDIEARVWQPDVSDDKSADNVLGKRTSSNSICLRLEVAREHIYLSH